MEKMINGEIELFRFIFSICVLLYHFRIDYNFELFASGAIGVEFFFIVTGVLLAKSVKEIQIDRNRIPYYTWSFLLRKISKFYPYYIIGVITQLLFVTLMGGVR